MMYEIEYLKERRAGRSFPRVMTGMSTVYYLFLATNRIFWLTVGLCELIEWGFTLSLADFAPKFHLVSYLAEKSPVVFLAICFASLWLEGKRLYTAGLSVPHKSRLGSQTARTQKGA